MVNGMPPKNSPIVRFAANSTTKGPRSSRRSISIPGPGPDGDGSLRVAVSIPTRHTATTQPARPSPAHDVTHAPAVVTSTGPIKNATSLTTASKDMATRRSSWPEKRRRHREADSAPTGGTTAPAEPASTTNSQSGAPPKQQTASTPTSSTKQPPVIDTTRRWP